MAAKNGFQAAIRVSHEPGPSTSFRELLQAGQLFAAHASRYRTVRKNQGLHGSNYSRDSPSRPMLLSVFFLLSALWPLTLAAVGLASDNG